MSDVLTFEQLKRAVAGSSAAFRCRRRLQPAGGPGDKVFPPTFAGAVYAREKRRLPGSGGDEPVECVLLDSVQSQANRMEQALQEALEGGKLELPLVAVDFSECHDPQLDPDEAASEGKLIDPVGRISSLQAPHRLADAILRDSELDGVPFRKSSKGKALNTVSLANATPVFELCPQALVFGMWDSTGPKGGLGPKFERAMVSEIVGVGAEIGDLRRGVRRDPLEIRAAVKVKKEADKSWEVAGSEAKGKGIVAPSEVNHSSVPFPKQRDKKTDQNYHDGVTIHYAEQTTTLSLIVLRRLRFPLEGGAKLESDLAARTVLAALGLTAATLAFDAGLGLRSRCLLWPDEPMEWELLDRPGKPPSRFALTREQALELLKSAIVKAEETGLRWSLEPIVLKPSKRLIELVRLSQLQAMKETGEGL